MLCAPAFFLAQNHLALTGGAIAWQKGLWLGLAVLYWFVLPVLIVCDARLPGGSGGLSPCCCC